MNHDREKEIITMLRACLVSSKGGVPISNVNRDFKLLVGHPIPYAELGFRTLENFLTSIPNVARISSSRAGEVKVEAVVDAGTAHIASLVAKQKSAPRRARPVKGTKIRRPLLPHKEPSQTKSRPVPVKGHAPVKTPRAVLYVPPSRRQKPQYEVPPRFLAAKVNSVVYSADTENNIVRAGASEVSPPVKDTRTYKQILEDYCVKNNMKQLVFKSLPICSKDGRPQYISSVKVNDEVFNSYPEQRLSSVEAEELAAKNAVEGLNVMKASSEGLKITQNTNDIVRRVVEIVHQKPNGLWPKRVPVEYKEKYREELPENWLDIVCARTRRVKVDNMTPGIPPILYPRAEEAVYELDERSIQNGSFHETPSTSRSTSASSTTEEIVETLAIPGGHYWDIFITAVVSTVDVSFRFVGDHSEEFEDMVTDMELHYTDHHEKVDNPRVGYLYAAKVDETWHRVEVLEVHGGKVTCYFCDHGDKDKIQLVQLYVLDKRFLKLPYQALHCQLVGLEGYANNSHATVTLTDIIIGKTLVAQVESRDDPISLVLYDTSSDDDVNINQTLMELLTSGHGAPQLPEAGGITNAYISHITSDGLISVQLQSETYSILQNMLDMVQVRAETDHRATSVDMNKLYLAKYHLDAKWYRAAVEDTTLSDGMVKVLFVDFGNIEVVMLSDLRQLDALSDKLTRFPYQAIRCKLHNIPPTRNHYFTQNVADRLYQLVPEDTPVLLRVVSPGVDGQPAIVELFKRIQPSNELVSINTTLSLDTELFGHSSEASDTVLSGDSTCSEVRCVTRRKSQTSESPHSSTTSGSRCDSETGFTSQSGNSSAGLESPELRQRSAKAVEQCIRSVSSELDFHVASLSLSPELTSMKALNPPRVPDVGSYFDVHVSLASHPGNFIIQPWSEGSNLERLMYEMNLFYSQEDRRKTLMGEDIEEGGYYAALHDDGQWYRIHVQQMLSRENRTVAAHFVDYGDFCLMLAKDLQPLWFQFRNLPFQAIKAKLADIWPIHGDWTVPDSVRFQELVVNQAFVSLIKNIEQDVSDQSAVVLSVLLINTSVPAVDVYIHELLIAEGRAVAAQGS